jgi:decaprenyl-phosphate phosphoribosyltransferase
MPPTTPGSSSASSSLSDFVRLARPTQWAKGMFVLVGPAYAIAGGVASHQPDELKRIAMAALGAFLAFGLASSGCYVINDIRDHESDRAHPRKRNRPIAAGRIGIPSAIAFALALLTAAGLAAFFLVPNTPTLGRPLLGICLAAYVVNVILYSIAIKHLTVADTISLATGFVLRVLGGCAAAGVEPSPWLLNVTFFLSMFLALGKRLGERRTMGDNAASARGVQAKYTDDLLRMAVVVTAVATLVSYSDYVQAQSAKYTLGFNLLWLTMLPATYAMLRCIVLVERGVHDDPTELATKDRPFQFAVFVFGVITACVVWASMSGVIPAKTPAPTTLPAPRVPA